MICAVFFEVMISLLCCVVGMAASVSFSCVCECLFRLETATVMWCTFSLPVYFRSSCLVHVYALYNRGCQEDRPAVFAVRRMYTVYRLCGAGGAAARVSTYLVLNTTATADRFLGFLSCLSPCVRCPLTVVKLVIDVNDWIFLSCAII